MPELERRIIPERALGFYPSLHPPCVARQMEHTSMVSLVSWQYRIVVFIIRPICLPKDWSMSGALCLQEH